MPFVLPTRGKTKKCLEASECKMGSGDESLWQTEKNFHYETFFLPPLCVRECARLYHEKLADSNLEKLYLAGFLRHGFLIKCAFTFFFFHLLWLYAASPGSRAFFSSASDGLRIFEMFWLILILRWSFVEIHIPCFDIMSDVEANVNERLLGRKSVALKNWKSLKTARVSKP